MTYSIRYTKPTQIVHPEKLPKLYTQTEEDIAPEDIQLFIYIKAILHTLISVIVFLVIHTVILGVTWVLPAYLALITIRYFMR